MIKEVTEAVVDVIHRATPEFGAWVGLSSLSSADTDPATNRLVVALIAVEEHPHLRNRPLVNSPTGYVRPPLALRLQYLMAYIGPHDEAQSRLARVIAAFHTVPIIDHTLMAPELAARVETITVRLTSTSADERNQVWGALVRSARLALFYQVDVAPIDQITFEGAGTINRHRIDYVGAP
jgi:hypothetical protein